MTTRKVAHEKKSNARRKSGTALKAVAKTGKIPAKASARLDVRISQPLRAEVIRAAEIRGKSITEFVTSAVLQAARDTIEEIEIIHLSKANQERFAASILAPPKPLNDALQEAFALHKARVRE